MVGVVLNVLQDYESDINNGDDETTTTTATTTAKEEAYYYPHKLRGDLCAITGGILYGLNDVLTEVTVSNETGDTTEYLGMLGLFGFLISFLQSLLLEREDIRKFFSEKSDDGDIDSNDDDDNGATSCSLPVGFLLLFSFVGVTMLSYVGGSRFLVISEAAFFNLSLLTGDLWSVVFSVVAERIVPQPLFFAALAAVLSGVVLYEMAPSPALEKQQGRTNDENDDCQLYCDNNNDNDAKDGIIIMNNNAQDNE